MSRAEVCATHQLGLAAPHDAQHVAIVQRLPDHRVEVRELRGNLLWAWRVGGIGGGSDVLLRGRHLVLSGGGMGVESRRMRSRQTGRG